MSNIKYIVIRGAGGNFSSGNDLNNFMLPEVQSLDKRMGAMAMAEILEELTVAIVKSRKPIFAIV
jgi:enoyl-CoA hydratase/carnithine racemase